MWVVPAMISGKTLRDANQCMFCGLAITNAKTIGWSVVVWPRHKNKPI